MPAEPNPPVETKKSSTLHAQGDSGHTPHGRNVEACIDERGATTWGQRTAAGENGYGPTLEFWISAKAALREGL